MKSTPNALHLLLIFVLSFAVLLPTSAAAASEQDFETFVATLSKDIDKLSSSKKQPPKNFGDLIVSLAKLESNSIAADADFSLDPVIDEYNKAYDLAVDEKGAFESLALTEYLDATEALVDELSPEKALIALDERKQDLVRRPPRGLSGDEVNAVLFDIDASQWQLQVLSGEGGELGHRALGGEIPRWVKTILEAIGISVSGFVNDKCLKYVIKLALAIIKCALFPGWSCILIAYYIFKVIQKCGESAYVDPCLGSPDPCCGVHCGHGYFCDWSTNGECEVDPYAEGCRSPSDCMPAEDCVRGECIPW